MIEVTRRDADYEVTVDGVVAGHSFFDQRGGTVVFTHTEIAPAFEGQGLGGRLAQEALDDVRARHLRVIARCPFIHAWIEKHPDYQDLLVQAS